MTLERFHSSRPDRWVSPRPWQDASARFAKHGPIQPMAEKSEPIDRFTVAIVALILAITLAAIWFAVLPAASDAPASGSSPAAVEAGMGRGSR